MRIKRLLPFAFCMSLTVAHSAAEEPPANPTVTAAPPVRSLLVASRQGVAAGDTLVLGILLEPAAGWHLYWNGLNDSGLAPQPALRLPPGAVWLEDWRWPAPERLVSPGKILDHVYHGRLLLTAALLLPQPLPPGDYLAIEGHVDWVACREACRFGRDSLSLHLPLCTQGAPTLASAAAERIAQVRAELPLPLGAGEAGLTLERGARGLLLSVAEATSLAFYPAQDCVELLNPLADGEASGSRLNLRLAHGTLAQGHLRGILAVLAAGERRHYLLDHPLDPPPSPAVGPTKE